MSDATDNRFYRQRSFQTENGNCALRATLGIARQVANMCRADGTRHSSFGSGMICGRLAVVTLWMDHDRLLAQAVENECHFLLGDYLRP